VGDSCVHEVAWWKYGNVVPTENENESERERRGEFAGSERLHGTLVLGASWLAGVWCWQHYLDTFKNIF
jgi:hypothetical protein